MGKIIALIVFLVTLPALAQSAQLTVKTRPAPLVTGVVIIAADCSWPAGFVVATLAPLSGGDGQPISYTYSGTASFAIPAGTNTLVVGANGVAPADCGQTINVQYTATQP